MQAAHSPFPLFSLHSGHCTSAHCFSSHTARLVLLFLLRPSFPPLALYPTCYTRFSFGRVAHHCEPMFSRDTESGAKNREKITRKGSAQRNAARSCNAVSTTARRQLTACTVKMWRRLICEERQEPRRTAATTCPAFAPHPTPKKSSMRKKAVERKMLVSQRVVRSGAERMWENNGD